MIRPFQDSDFEDIAALNKVCYLSPCPDEELRKKLTGKTWVRTFFKFLAGCVITEARDGKTWIWSLTVDSDSRRQGIGNSLLEEVEKHFSELWLYTELDSAGYRLYSKRGYEVVETLPDFYGPNSPAVVMVKR